METDSREFFEQVGNLFYSLSVDRSIEPIEVSELKMLISKDWMAQPQNSGLPTPENVHAMFVEMDALQTAQVTAADAFNSFARYYDEHSEDFTAAIIDRIIKTATAINALLPVHDPDKKNYFGDLRLLFRKKTNITNS